MSSINRVLQKRRKAQGQSLGYQTATTQGNQLGASGYSPKNQSNQKSLYDDQKEKLFQEYAELSQYNPQSFEYSNTHMPASLTLYNRYRGQLSCFVSPINESLQYTSQSANNIPRCASCRSYMNYYNQITKQGYKCFICGRLNGYEFEYTPSQQLIERTSPSYMVDGPTGVYNSIPPQKTFIFLVDVSKEASQCKMISYIVPVIKDVLSREDMGQTQIYFYTYDESVHQYDFSGDEVERTILDPSITNRNFRPIDCFLSDIRDKLFTFLDSLEDVAQKNTKHGSCFYQVFEYVYENIKHTGGKMFIFQANQAIIGEAFSNQTVKSTPNTQQAKLKSNLQTRNKTLFNRFIQPMLLQNISSSIFVFGRAYKNIRVYSDLCKLTNSELCYYSKDSPEDLTKFYYDFYYLLGATYYSDVRIELTISSGWYFTAVYGNLYRLKQYISFKFCHIQPSKKICVVYLPQQGGGQQPYFSMQIITHYIYNRKQYMQINTSVMPLTTNLGQLFDTCNHNILSASIYKTYLSSIRLEDINSVKNKYLKQVASIWKAAHEYYKGALSPQFRNVVLGFLSFLKNYHTQIDLINDSLIFQRVVSQRNFLQSFNYQDLATFFVPYLFDLTTIGNDRCLQGDNFLYPDLCQLKFSSVKEGLFIMDCGLALYLYVSKSCHPNYLKCLFGKDKFVKGQVLSEEMINEQQNSFNSQVSNLIRVLRESKSYGWIPLYIVRCGQNSINQKNFYLNFIEEKYQQFKSNKMNYDEFVSMLSKQYF